MLWTIYTDLDGVVADFMSGVIEVLYGKTAIEPIMRGWPKGEYDMAEALGQSLDYIWKAIDREGATFWRELKLYGWSIPLVNQLCSLGDVVFLSGPSEDGSSAHGKVDWIKQHFSLRANDYILTPAEHKWRLANDHAILIDDSADNCNAWAAAGGTAILFPQPWNDSVIDTDVVSYVIGKVKLVIGDEKQAVVDG